METEGLCRLIAALEQRCECELGVRKEDCADAPIFRWWRSILVDDDELRRGAFAPEARRSA